LLTQGTGFHNPDGIPDIASIVVVVRVKLRGFVHELAVDGMLEFPFFGYHNGFIHFIANDHANTLFSQISLFILFHCCMNLNY